MREPIVDSKVVVSGLIQLSCMKASAILVSILLCSQLNIRAQSIAPSITRQVFSLQQGDSLIYHEWTEANICGTICNSYILKVVDSVSYSTTQDTMSIFFQTQLIRFDTVAVNENICGQCKNHFDIQDITSLSSSVWEITNLDSSIVSCMDSVYGPQGTINDSIYRSDLYNGSKQNLYNFSGYGFSSTSDIYADSIGIVYKAESVELSDNNREQLVYYHKANGNTWGTSYINVGIRDDYSTYSISVYPNPAYDRFAINMDLNATVDFELFDVLAERVISQKITSRTTEIKRNNLAPGIYYWQIHQDGILLKAGALVME